MRLRGLIETMRLPNSVLSGIGAVFSILVFTSYNPKVLALLIGFLTGFLLTASSMIINDVVDLEVDRVNKPWKPIPRGDITPGFAKQVSLSLVVAGISVNIILGVVAVIVALAYALIGIGYSYMRRYTWSHMLVALSTTGPIVYGYTVSGSSPEDLLFAVLFAATMFTVNLAREFLKAIQDIQGDKARGYKTIATIYGVEKASKIMITTAVIAVSIALSTTTLPLSNTYRVLITTAAGAYMYSMIKAYKYKAKPDKLESPRKTTLIAMTIGTLSILAAKLPL